MKHKPKKHPHEKPLKGLHSAVSSAPQGKQKPQTDPTKGLRDAIKAKDIVALALQAASQV